MELFEWTKTTLYKLYTVSSRYIIEESHVICHRRNYKKQALTNSEPSSCSIRKMVASNQKYQKTYNPPTPKCFVWPILYRNRQMHLLMIFLNHSTHYRALETQTAQSSIKLNLHKKQDLQILLASILTKHYHIFFYRIQKINGPFLLSNKGNTYNTFWNTIRWQWQVPWRGFAVKGSFIKSPLSNFSISQFALIKMCPNTYLRDGNWKIKYGGFHRTLKYLQIVVTTVCVMDNELFPNFQIPRRLLV